MEEYLKGNLYNLDAKLSFEKANRFSFKGNIKLKKLMKEIRNGKQRNKTNTRKIN